MLCQLGQGGRCAGSRSLHSGDTLEKLPEQCSHLGDTSVDGPRRPKNYSEGGAYCSVYLVPVSCSYTGATSIVFVKWLELRRIQMTATSELQGSFLFFFLFYAVEESK